MEMFDLFIAYVSWGSDGKKRPVLILEQEADADLLIDFTVL
jgi:hypothetical protein